MVHGVAESDTTERLHFTSISECSKGAGYKNNTQKPLAFLYTDNEESQRELRTQSPFTIATKTIKYLGIKVKRN